MALPFLKKYNYTRLSAGDIKQMNISQAIKAFDEYFLCGVPSKRKL